MEHIFIGEINRKGFPVGFHHEGDLAKEFSQVIESTRSAKDELGVFEANVIIRGVNKLTLSSFFPTDISPKEVLQTIRNDIIIRRRLNAFFMKQLSAMGR